jgi:hypothetical protein
MPAKSPNSGTVAGNNTHQNKHARDGRSNGAVCTALGRLSVPITDCSREIPLQTCWSSCSGIGSGVTAMSNRAGVPTKSLQRCAPNAAPATPLSSNAEHEQ